MILVGYLLSITLNTTPATQVTILCKDVVYIFSSSKGVGIRADKKEYYTNYKTTEELFAEVNKQCVDNK